MARKIVKWGALFALVYVALELCSLLLERRVSGTWYSVHKTVDSLINIWDQGVVRRLSEADWMRDFAFWIYQNSSLNVAQIAFLLRALTYLLIGASVYFMIGGAVGLMLYRKRRDQK